MVDQLNVSYLYKKHGVFYFAKRVPFDLRSYHKNNRVVICLRRLHLINKLTQEKSNKLSRYWLRWWCRRGEWNHSPICQRRIRVLDRVFSRTKRWKTWRMDVLQKSFSWPICICILDINRWRKGTSTSLKKLTRRYYYLRF